MTDDREEDIRVPLPDHVVLLLLVNLSTKSTCFWHINYIRRTPNIFTMKKIYILVLHLHLALATQHHCPIFNRWTSPNSKPGALSKRGIGYRPEFGACEEGQETCSDACGDGFEECGTGTDAAVFCYNPDEGETCCGDKDGSKSWSPFLGDPWVLFTDV